MADLEFVPNRIPTFGGLCTLIERSELPLGLSPNCQNVKFAPGVVASRDGYALYWTGDSLWTTGATGTGMPTGQRILGVGGFITLAGTRYRIFYTENGAYLAEAPAGTVQAVAVSNASAPGNTVQMTTAFGRTIIATSNDTTATRELIQWDGTTLSAFSPCGPGRAPINSAYPAGGNIAAGSRLVAVAFLTTSGYLTPLSPVATVSPPGGTKISLQYIPTGPPNVIARYLFFSVNNDTSGANMYCVTGSMIVADNTTTTLTNLDFTEAQLTDGISADALGLMDRVVPVRAIGSCLYSGRVFLWGVERSDGASLGGNSPGTWNLTFDGGADPQAPTIPAGWNNVVANAAAQAVAYGEPGVTGGVWKTLSDGSGAVAQCAILGISAAGGAQAFTPGATYQMEIQFRKLETSGAPLPVGQQLTVTLTWVDAAASGITSTNFNINPTLFTAGDQTWQIYLPPATTVSPPNAVALSYRLSWSMGAVAGRGWEIKRIRIYPAGLATNDSTVFGSSALAPERLQATTGLLSVANGNGQYVRKCFALRNFLYIAKDRSLYVTSDNGQEPANWSIDVVSDIVGTQSVHGVAIGDGYAIIAGRAGVYMISGGKPEKLSQEIEPTWRQIDWTQGHRLFSLIDEQAKIYRVSAVMQDGTRQIFTCDFVEGWNDPVSGGGHGRKWSLEPSSQWLCGTMVETDAKALVPMFGGGMASGYTAFYRSQTFSTWSWTGTAPTITAGQADPRGGTTATQWAFAGSGTGQAPTSINVGSGAYCSYRIAIKGPAGTTVTVTNGFNPASILLTGAWQTLSGVFGPNPAPGPVPKSVFLTFPAGTYYVDDFATFASQYAQGWAASGASTGWAATLDSTQHYDLNAAIDAVYETAPLGDEIGRSLFSKVIARIRGAGTLLAKYVKPDATTVALYSNATTAPPTSAALAAAPNEDLELGAQQQFTQLGIRIETNGYGDWFVLRRLCALVRRSAFGWTRGHN